MTKLMEWLFVVGSFAAVWVTVVFRLVDGVSDEMYNIVFFLPFAAVIIFGLVSLFIILYRVITFNDCMEAAAELKQQIKEAKKELSAKGMVFS